jgi:hypothetical protein
MTAFKTPNQAAEQRFNEKRIAAYRLLEEAVQEALRGGLDTIYLNQVRAAAALAGAIFAPITHGDATDFSRLRKDLAFIAEKVDPLIEAIGEEAQVKAPTRGELSDIDFDDFRRPLFKALDGQALFVLDRLAEEAEREPEDDDPDTKAETKREFERV